MSARHAQLSLYFLLLPAARVSFFHNKVYVAARRIWSESRLCLQFRPKFLYVHPFESKSLGRNCTKDSVDFNWQFIFSTSKDFIYVLREFISVSHSITTTIYSFALKYTKNISVKEYKLWININYEHFQICT